MSHRQPAASESTKKKLSAEQLEKLTQRVYTDSMTHRQRNVEVLEHKFYKEEEPKQIPKDQVEASAVRQHDDEMARRKKGHEALMQKYYKEAEPKTMGPSEVEDSVKRIYSDSMRRKEDTQRKLEQKFAFKRSEARPLSREQAKACGDRLCKPSKRKFSEAEINKILGF